MTSANLVGVFFCQFEENELTEDIKDKLIEKAEVHAGEDWVVWKSGKRVEYTRDL